MEAGEGGTVKNSITVLLCQAVFALFVRFELSKHFFVFNSPRQTFGEGRGSEVKAETVSVNCRHEASHLFLFSVKLK